ncbi:hypothetical protein FDECE_2610 [Fusarium decemcellulare]|nr:hypothetical protein FDECE_2610 [Fusarium decemcellulare]
MRITSCLPALALAIKVSCLPAAEVVTDAPEEGFRIVVDDNIPSQLVEPEWEVQVFPDKEPRRFKGSIEQVYKEVLDLNPSYEEDNPPVNVTLGADGTELSKRAPSGDPNCLGSGRGANMLRLQEGVFYLDRLNAWIDLAPRRCSRVSCSFNAGIAICNDRHDLTWSLHTSLIISYVQRISRSCSYFGVDVAGQQFDTGGFNVIAAKMNCNAGSGWDVSIPPP